MLSPSVGDEFWKKKTKKFNANYFPFVPGSTGPFVPDGQLGKAIQDEQTTGAETEENAENVMTGESRHQILGQGEKRKTFSGIW